MTEVPATPLWLHPKLNPLGLGVIGPFVQADSGELLTPSPDAKGISRSSDLGKTWEHAPLFDYTPRHKEFKISRERVLFKTKSGTIILSFMNMNEKIWGWKAELEDALPNTRLPHYVTRSADNGKTWSDPVMLHEAWTGEIRNMIQLDSGRLVISSMKLLHKPGRHGVLTYYSDDDGVTWTPSPIIDMGGCGHHGGVTEATIAQMKNGSVLMLIRTNWKQFWRAISHDGGAHWRELTPSGIDASSAPGLLTRLASGRLLLLWNRLYAEGETSTKQMRGGDNQWSEVPTSNHREELSLAWYDENTHTISKPVVIARQKDHWLSYPRVYEHKPGELWITNMTLSRGNLIDVILYEKDFV